LIWSRTSAVLEAAYDDALGVTAAFNLNLLRHLNRVAGTDFDVSGWRHVARFDGVASRIEMHLEARRAVTVRWSGGERRFAEGERIHTENSYKWTPAAFEDAAARGRFRRGVVLDGCAGLVRRLSGAAGVSHAFRPLRTAPEAGRHVIALRVGRNSGSAGDACAAGS
jgi:hypothetical protein